MLLIVLATEVIRYSALLVLFDALPFRNNWVGSCRCNLMNFVVQGVFDR